MLAVKLFDNYESNLKYYQSLDRNDRASYLGEIDQAQDICERLIYFSNTFKQEKVSKELEGRYGALLQSLGMRPRVQE